MTTVHEAVSAAIDEGHRFALSASTTSSPLGALSDVVGWMEERRRTNDFRVEQIPFAELEKWSFDPETGNLGHASGRFFTIEGIRAFSQIGPIHEWTQPIINQPENGLLGVLVKEFDGILHFLVQAKMEPGNPHLIELSPTVQATRSNFTRVHQGASIRYFEYFAGPARARVVTDVLQSEQGDSFYRKRNRNMVVEVTGDVPVGEDFRWLTLGQIHALLSSDSTVNMDIRTVLSTLPIGGSAHLDRGDTDEPAVAGFRSDLREALCADLSSRHRFADLLSWLTGLKCHYEMRAERVPLNECTDWKRTEDDISHVDGQFFRVIGVSVQARTREVTSWTQPMLTPSRTGIAAYLVRRIDGVPHVLVQGKPQPGLFDFFEVGPTVQCVNADYTALPESEWPPHLRYVLDAPASQVRFSALLSEEGGRFYQRENRYQVIEVPEDYPEAEGKNYRWVTPHQLKRLAGLANCVNVEARTLLTCLQSLW